MISNWALIYGREKGTLVSLTIVLPSPILLRRRSSLLSSWVIQALARAVGAAAVQPPHFFRNVSPLASKMLFVSPALETLHTRSTSQSPESLACYYGSCESRHQSVIMKVMLKLSPWWERRLRSLPLALDELVFLEECF